MLGIHVRFDDISEWASSVISLVVKGKGTEREVIWGGTGHRTPLWPENNFIERWIKLPRDWGHLGGQNAWAQELSGETRFGEEALCLWLAHCEMSVTSSRSLLFRGCSHLLRARTGNHGRKVRKMWASESVGTWFRAGLWVTCFFLKSQTFICKIGPHLYWKFDLKIRDDLCYTPKRTSGIW